MKKIKKFICLLSLLLALTGCRSTYNAYKERHVGVNSSISFKEEKGYVRSAQGYFANILFLPVKMGDQMGAAFSGVNPMIATYDLNFPFGLFVLPFAYTIDVVTTVFGSANYDYLSRF